ncbi:hypothetical protein ACF05W_23505 [Streptomyces lydicus]|uniref:hypothetical protein n=1 Tax=Streptomyces lydicus TaxID=47763 RepID=UPI0036FA1E66
MKGTVARWWRRVGKRCSQAGGLLLAFVLIGLTTACSRGPSERKLRAQATSPGAESLRAAEERQMQALIQRLSAVEGLEHTLTRFVDSCARPYNGSVFENMRSPYVLTCSMRAVACFGVRGDMSEVLPRIRAAGIATWGPRDNEGRNLPHAAGTVTYALSYHRAHGRYPDGSLMSAPTLTAPGLRIDWDRANLPLPHRVEEPAPLPTGRFRHLPALLDPPQGPDERGFRAGPIRHRPQLQPPQLAGLRHGPLLHRAPPEVTAGERELAARDV